MTRISVLLLLLLLLAGVTAAETPRHPLGELEAHMQELGTRVRPHLVRIIRDAETSGAAETPVRRFIGTGVVYAENRILTCASVVGPALQVTVVTSEGDTSSARVLGVDRRTNLAVVAGPAGLPPITVCHDGILFPGDLVLAAGLGRPDGALASFGTVVLASGPSLGFTEVDMIEVSAPIVPGFIGGALLDEKGRMVGLISGRMSLDSAQDASAPGTSLISGFLLGGRLTTASTSSTTLALPVSQALEMARALADSGVVQRGYLGLQVELTEVVRPHSPKLPGVLVHQVVPGAPADRAGLIPGDVILEYAEGRVRSPEDLSFLVAATIPGSRVRLAFLRRGSRGQVWAQIDQAPDLEWNPGMDAFISSPALEAGLAPALR